MTQEESRFHIILPGVAPKPAKWLLMDETDLHWCPDLATRGLHPKGQQLIIQAPGVDEVKYLLGSVDPFWGDGLWEIYSHKRSEEFCLHLEHLREMFFDSFLFVGCDNAPAHCSQATQEFLEESRDWVEVVYFPTYSPNLNGIEHLWAFLREQVTRDVVYESLDAKCQAIIAWLEALPGERIIQTLGTWKKLTKTR